MDYFKLIKMNEKYLIESVVEQCSLLTQHKNAGLKDLEVYLSSLVSIQPGKNDLLARFITKLGLLLVEHFQDKNELFRVIQNWLLNCKHSYSRSIIMTVLTSYLKEKKHRQIIPNELLNSLATINDSSYLLQDGLIIKILFLKAVFKYNTSISVDCLNHLSSLLANSQLIDLNRRHASIYTMNKLIRCGLIICDKESTAQVVTDIWTYFLNNLPQILSLQDRTLYFRLLLLLLRLVVGISDETVNSEENQVLLNRAFYQDNEFSLDKVFVSGQDDDLIIDLNSWCLELETKRKCSCRLVNELVQNKLNGHVLFYRLASQFISFNTETVIEWLISQESTKFLAYFVRYLKYLTQDVEKFKRTEHIDTLLMTEFLAKFCSRIKKLKKSFPYNCDPLIKLLDKFIT